MLNLIKAELYKSNRPSLYILNGVIIAIIITLVSLEYLADPLYGEGKSVYLTFDVIIISFIVVLLAYIPYLHEDYKYGTLKNIASSNMTMTSIYLSKFISQIILFLITILISVFAFEVIINIYGIAGNNQFSELMIVVKKIIIVMPVYIGLLALYDMIAIIFKKEAIAMFMCGIISSILEDVIDKVVNYIGGIAEKINPYLFANPILPFMENGDITSEIVNRSFIGGTISSIIFLTIGLIIFNKKEIR